jgi:putative SOS response-associated peptidase YedK
MCGRYSLAGPNPAQVAAQYPALESIDIRRRYNVAPGDDVLAVTTDKAGTPRGELLRWGLVPSWSDSPAGGMKMINARSETVAERPAYRRAFQSMRCLIIADGFYEWQRSERGKRAFHITAEGRPVFAFAGLWSIWHGAEDQVLRSCSILTTAANEAVAPLHDRMPVILPRDVESVWIDPSTPQPQLLDLLVGLAPSQTHIRPVGPAVNDARYDGPECLADEAPESQTTLF